EPRRPADVGDEAEPHLGQPELAVARRDAQVEGERQLEPQPRHVAMERPDDRLLDRLEPRERRLHLADVRAERRTRLALDVAGQHAEVDAGREDGPFAVHDHGADLAIALRGGHRVDEGEEQLPMDGVSFLGPVEPDVEQRVLAAGDYEGGGYDGGLSRAGVCPQSFTRAETVAISSAPYA